MQLGVEAVVLAEAMPSRWSDFIRNAPMETVKPLGTRAADGTQAQQQYGQQVQSYRSGSAKALYYGQQQQQAPGQQP